MNKEDVVCVCLYTPIIYIPMCVCVCIALIHGTKKCNKLVKYNKKNKTHRYSAHTSGYQWQWEEQYRGWGVGGTNRLV